MEIVSEELQYRPNWNTINPRSAGERGTVQISTLPVFLSNIFANLCHSKNAVKTPSLRVKFRMLGVFRVNVALSST